MASGPAGEQSQETPEGDPFSGFPSGTSVLVSGPPMVGKYETMLEALAAGNRDDEAGVVVSTGDDRDSVVEDLRRIYPRFDPALLGVVECLASDEGAPEESSDDRVHRVGSPADLTGVGIGASELLNAFHREGVDGFRLGVDSLSTLLLYTEFDRLARFLHVLSGRIDRADGVGLFVINPNTVDAGQFDQLTTLFDGIVELREEDGGREIRVRGIPGADAEWRPYVPPEFD